MKNANIEVLFSRAEVEACEVGKLLTRFNPAKMSPAAMQQNRERCSIVFNGFRDEFEQRSSFSYPEFLCFFRAVVKYWGLGEACFYMDRQTEAFQLLLTSQFRKVRIMQHNGTTIGDVSAPARLRFIYKSIRAWAAVAHRAGHTHDQIMEGGGALAVAIKVFFRRKSDMVKALALERKRGRERGLL